LTFIAIPRDNTASNIILPISIPSVFAWRISLLIR
jgi:hypothetical protein